jgi:hypothetical protein
LRLGYVYRVFTKTSPLGKFRRLSTPKLSWLWDKSLGTAALVFLVPVQHAKAELQLGLLGQSFFTSPPATSIGQNSFYQSLTGAFLSESQGKILEGRIKAQGLFTINQQNFNFIELPEAFLATSRELSEVQLTVGRRLESWSKLDQDWGLGVYQPRFRWDFVDPEPVALVGAALSYEYERARFVVLGSPIFVPDRAAPIDVRGGRIESGGPWATRTPERLPIGTQGSAPIFYETQASSVSDVVFQPVFSAGFSFNEPKSRPARVVMDPSPTRIPRAKRRLGSVATNSEGSSASASSGRGEIPWWFSTSYAWKPVNQIALAVRGVYDLATERAQVTIRPRVFRHHVVAAQTGVRLGDWDFAVAGLYDRPVDPGEAPPGFTTQDYSQATSWSPSLEWTPSSGPLWLPSIRASYLYVRGGFAPDQGSLAPVGSSLFEDRYLFGEALRVEGRVRFTRAWSVSLGSVYDLRQDGQIFSPQVRFLAMDRLSLQVGADFLTSEKAEGTTAGSQDFIYRYRANDRVYGGLQYAF